MIPDAQLSFAFLGDGSLLIRCAELVLRRGHRITAVATTSAAIQRWADERGVRAIRAEMPAALAAALAAALREHSTDYLISVAFLAVLPESLLRLPRRGAINFHDGPLPQYAGLNVPAWALLNGELTHGVTWHLMTGEVDRGDIVQERAFPVAPRESALTLNAKCYEAGLEAFDELVSQLAANRVRRRPQQGADTGVSTGARGRYFGRADRPDAACTVAWTRPASVLDTLARALDFGAYPNPLGVPKVVVAASGDADRGGAGNGDAERVLAVRDIQVVTGASRTPPGTITRIAPETVHVAAADGIVALGRLATLEGRAVTPTELAARFGLREGSVLPALDEAQASTLSALDRQVARHESFWVQRLATLQPLDLPYPLPAANGAAQPAPGARVIATAAAVPIELHRALAQTAAGLAPADALLAALLCYFARLTSTRSFDVGFQGDALRDALRQQVAAGARWFAERVPLRVDIVLEAAAAEGLRAVAEEVTRVRRRGTYARDVWLRYPELAQAAGDADGRGAFPLVLECGSPASDRLAPGSRLTVVVAPDGATHRWVYDRAALTDEDIAGMQEQFRVFLAALVAAGQAEAKPLARLPLVTDSERAHLLQAWNVTGTDTVPDTRIEALVAAQAARTPEAVAVVSGRQTLTYRELQTRAALLARHLRVLGVGPECRVGICLERTVELPVALLGVLEAGGAYVPLDPTYPRARLAALLADAQPAVVLTQQRLVPSLPPEAGSLVRLDADWTAIARGERGDGSEGRDGNGGREGSGGGGAAPPLPPPPAPKTSADLAYVIYTSGSTGQPKGVMVEHRNVVNFFAGMDHCLGDGPPGTWLALTSLSFDISVLELLWTLSRGFTVVLAPASAAAERAASAPPLAPIGFSLFYFSSDEGAADGDKYRLLLEGARYADLNDFAAVWTPERHFHAFGGLYPNPSVTSAALAAVTKRVGIRAGSVVLPLHHPIRVAEEWAVVDNLSQGRVGISFASGWQPDDFVLRPESFADSKQVLRRDIDVVRRLWRGETVPFSGPGGKEIPVRTLPRPTQPELPCWLTSAGSPATFELAGALGASVLTHLLGQSVEELSDKLARYRAAWQEQGCSGRGHVTLMLHTFVAPDERTVLETVRGPLIEYLRSSVSLIQHYAVSFPAFRRQPPDAPNAGAVDFTQLSPEEMDTLLEHAFERYYRTSGLFGTPESCMEMIDRLRAIGIDEVACLIDFGVDPDVVLRHLPYLNTLRVRCSEARQGEPDEAVATLIARHGVSHLQCTPSLARMLVLDPTAREALRPLRQMLVGGEPFPPSLAAELRALVSGEVLNMYGPTETTVWSATHRVDAAPGRVPVGRVPVGRVPVGRPIANTQLYILDPSMEPVPVGVTGELYIGGAGVARGYLNRPDLTAERFLPDPFGDGAGGRLYRTGDVACYRRDGTVELLGRLDDQVKIRGFRVELGEVEAMLARCAGVRECAVAAVPAPADDAHRLVAYYVPTSTESAPAVETLRDFVAERLPEHMVPAAIVRVDALPRTATGKLDRRALPPPESARPDVSADFVGPRTPLEERIAAIWTEILGLDRVGIHDRFFELGGDSLLAVRILTRLRDAFGQSLRLGLLFEHPTVAGLAAVINGAKTADREAEPPPIVPVPRESRRVLR